MSFLSKNSQEFTSYSSFSFVPIILFFEVRVHVIDQYFFPSSDRDETRSIMNDEKMLEKAVDAAKKFENFDDVLMAVSLHPEWLIVIPEKRKWAILHQVILSGNVNHLNQLLHLQKNNPKFRLLVDTANGEKISDILRMRDDIEKMEKYIEKLIELDKMLNYAQQCQWDQCYDIVKKNPSYFNEKPPYRRSYLIHQMIYADNLEQFKRFQKIPGFTFNFTVRSEEQKQKINVFARKNNCIDFAKYLEEQNPSLLIDDDSVYAEISQPPPGAITKTDGLALMLQSTITMQPEDSSEDTSPKLSRSQLREHITVLQSQRQKVRQETTAATNNTQEKKYNEDLLETLTCFLTGAVFVDPGR